MHIILVDLMMAAKSRNLQQNTRHGISKITGKNTTLQPNSSNQ